MTEANDAYQTNMSLDGTQDQAVCCEIEPTPLGELLQNIVLTSIKLSRRPFGCSLESFEIIVSRFCLEISKKCQS